MGTSFGDDWTGPRLLRCFSVFIILSRESVCVVSVLSELQRNGSYGDHTLARGPRALRRVLQQQQQHLRDASCGRGIAAAGWVREADCTLLFRSESCGEWWNWARFGRRQPWHVGHSWRGHGESLEFLPPRSFCVDFIMLQFLTAVLIRREWSVEWSTR